MNPYTNEIADLDALRRAAAQEEAMKTAEDALASLGEGWEAVPEDLNHAARCVLRGESRGVISRVSKGALSKYAARRRGEIRRTQRR